jgi:hypothetical protein
MSYTVCEKGNSEASLAFNTTALLGAGGGFTSPIIDIRGIKQVQTNVLSDVDGTMDFIFYSDALAADEVRKVTVPYTASNGYQLFGAPKFASYVVYKYKNGATPQGDFFFETWLYNEALSAQVLGAESFIAPSMTASLTRTIGVGKTPDGIYKNLPETGYVGAGTTTTPLLAATTFDTGIIEIDGFSQLATEILADEDGTVVGTWYSDSAGTDVVRTFTRPYTAADGYAYFSSPVFAPYFRYVYTNGGTDQTDFYFSTKLLTQAISGQILGLKDFIPSNVAVNLGRNIIVGEDTNGNFRNVPTDVEGNLNVHIASPVTAFSDLRTAELTPQAHITFEYNINPKIVNTSTANGGTVTQADAMAVVKTSTNAAGEASFDSIRLLKYRSGLGALARFTGLFTTGVANSSQGVGVGNSENGFFFGYDGAAFGILHRIDSVDTWIPQTTWNLDVLDGTGRSGMTIDPTNINVFEITYQYLGAGMISFYVEDDSTGDFTPVHRIQYANSNTTPSLYNPALPLGAFAVNTGNTSDLTVKSASMSAFVEGKDIVTGPSQTFGSSVTTASELAVFTIGNKTTFASKTNLVNGIMKGLSCANDSNGIATFTIYEDTGLGGVPVYADIDTNGSVMESDVAGTTVTGGTVIASFSVGKDSGTKFDLASLGIIMKPGSIYTVSAQTAGASAAMGASLSWVEDF